MSGRHARTDNRRPIARRITPRPGHAAVAVVAGFAIAAPVVAAQPLAAPTMSDRVIGRSVENVRAAAEPNERRSYRPGEGPVNHLGLATIVANGYASARAGDTATFMSRSVIAAREAAAAEAARQAAEATEAAERAATRQREAEAAAAADAAAAERAAEQPAPAVASGSAWDALAQCESGGNWAINTGNGYYGGLQFSLSSWQGVGGTGYPHEASRETQIAMGERLKAQGGWGHWPSCSRKLGLR